MQLSLLFYTIYKWYRRNKPHLAPPNAGCCHLVIGEFNEIILEMLAVYFESFSGVLLTQFFLRSYKKTVTNAGDEKQYLADKILIIHYEKNS